MRTPIVVEIEADQAEDSEFEEDFPTGHEASVAVERMTKVGRRFAFFGYSCRQQHAKDSSIRVAFAELVREQCANSENP
jgi:hypothetical protein